MIHLAAAMREIVALGNYEIEIARHLLPDLLMIGAPIRNAVAIAALVAFIGSAGVMLLQQIGTR